MQFGLVMLPVGLPLAATHTRPAVPLLLCVQLKFMESQAQQKAQQYDRQHPGGRHTCTTVISDGR